MLRVLRSFSIGADRDRPVWRSAGWPASTEHVHWGVLAAFVVFAVAQLVGGLWAIEVVGGLYGDLTTPVADRPMWTLTVSGLGLWAAYLLGPVVVNRLTDSGPRWSISTCGPHRSSCWRPPRWGSPPSWVCFPCSTSW